MKRHLRLLLALGVLAALFFPLAGCGGGGGSGNNQAVDNNWDAMEWDNGTWQ